MTSGPERIPAPTPRQPGTTHAGWGEGRPRLLVSRDDDRLVFELTEDRTAIGSAPDCDLRLPDAEPLHAEIEHDDRDEYVLTLHSAGEMNANPRTSYPDDGQRTETLRTGARFTVAGWTLVFQREEFADHGRPYGGREGGEMSDQPAQPARPDYRHDHDHDHGKGRGFEVRDG